MDKDFEKTMAMLDGQTINSYINSQLSDADKQQIDNAIEILFAGLSLHQWLMGGALADAWRVALDKTRDVVFSFTETNPATSYARAAVFQFRHKWERKIISAIHAGDKINCPPEKFNAWNEDANIKIQNGTEILRRVIMGFVSSSATRTTNIPTYTIQMSEKSRTNTIESREHERVHEQ